MELCVIEGDGIGHEVIPAAVTIMKAVLPDLEVHNRPAGWDHFSETGVSLPEETIETARRCGAVLFGACTSPSYPVPNYTSPIVALRRNLAAYANLRPTAYMPVPTARAGIDLMVVRENTEDLYAGMETTGDDGATGTATKLITRGATERIAHLAFRLARLMGRHLVTVVHKGNVLPQTDGLFRRVAFEVAEQYPDIDTDELLVDTAAYWMVKEPTRFELILTPNLYGDILSDMAAAWGGGIGMAPALNLGDTYAIAEPVHGSAPDIAGKGIANPTAAILSSALLIRHYWHRVDEAERIETAVRRTLEQGAFTADVRAEQSLSTEAFMARLMDNL